MRLYIEVRFGADARGRMPVRAEPGAWSAPRFVLARSAEGNTWRIGAGEPIDVAARLSRLAGREAPWTGAAGEPAPPPPERLPSLRACLEAAGPIASEWRGPIHRISGPGLSGPGLPALAEGIGLVTPGQHDDWTALRAAFPEVDARAAERGPVALAVEEGEARSVCFAAAGRADGGLLAAVLTAPAWRGRGLAARCCARFALAAIEGGGAPLYAARWSDGAALSVARQLGAPLCGELLCWA
jgi:GNAT superfamily N-acetyltransferase